jgi:undecaprenyl-diphosphatase
MLESLIEFDKEAFLYLNGLGTEAWDSFWLFMTDKLNAIPLYLLLLVLTFRVYGLKKTLLVLVFVALLITATDQLTNFFKYGVGRFRPCHDITLSETMRLVKNSCGGKYGYFSAHAANSFAVAVFFSVLLRNKFRWMLPLLLLWALIVAYSRIYIGVHFPLDVLTGMAIGMLFGWLFAKLNLFAQIKAKLV